MPPVPTPKGPSTAVVNQGTLEMATTVQVGFGIPISLSVSFETSGLVQKGLMFSDVL